MSPLHVQFAYSTLSGLLKRLPCPLDVMSVGGVT